jgi:DNA-binding NarL/FixJ family response regulator
MTANKTTKSAEADPTVPATLKDAVAADAVRLFRQRKNGTLRSLPYLMPDSETRKEAEAVAKRREAGETVGAIAEDLNLSVATVRRMITNLLLAQQIEEGLYADKYMPGEKKVIVSTVGEDEEAGAT